MNVRGVTCGLFLMMLLICGVVNSSVIRNKLLVSNPTVSSIKGFPIDYRFRSDFIISEERPVSFENEDGRPKYR